MKQFFSKLINTFFNKKGKKFKLDLKKQKGIKIAVISVAIVIFVAISAYFIIKDPSFFVVAKVNNTYITRFELNKVLVKSFGKQALEELAYKKLAEKEFKRNNIVVSKEELALKIDEITQSLGGMSLEDALNSSNMTLEDLNENVVFQLSLEKLLEPKVVVAPEDVTNFLTENSAQLTDMTDEEKNTYAQEQVKAQNLQVEMGKWFEELKQNAKIKFYL